MRILLLASILLAFCISGNAIQSQTVTAKSWLVSDLSGKIIASENIDELRPIASITKLLTAMVVLDAEQNMDEAITLVPGTKKRSGLSFTRRQLMEMSLVHSDNRASFALCDHYPGGRNSCIAAMNDKAHSLGMLRTSMSDPTGLDNRNVSTARELILLTKAARTYGPIIDAAKQQRVEIKLKKKWLFFNNTNPMIGKDRRVIVSKTGFTNPAGGCIVLLLDTELGDRVVVVLGSKNTRTRIPEAEFIAKMEE
jgi:D-alanyl-D-alanine endopeptidase (penicillin-binding protein 7)